MVSNPMTCSRESEYVSVPLTALFSLPWKILLESGVVELVLHTLLDEEGKAMNRRTIPERVTI